MFAGPQLLLIGAVAAVGVLHTVVPDHWVPITLIARQQGWTKREVGRAALIAGTGHTVSTLLIGLVVWIAGVAFATRFGTLVSMVSSVALIAFGSWIALASMHEMRSEGGHAHARGSNDGVHALELEQIATADGILELSIVEAGRPPHFRLAGTCGNGPIIETQRENGEKQRFEVRKRGDYWESLDEIPEPHAFRATVSVVAGDRVLSYETTFAKHGHDLQDRGPESAHAHKPKRPLQTTLLLILGSSPMVEGIPAFFAAGTYGPDLVAVMAVVFALATISTYVLLCVSSVAGLQRVHLGPLELYGEVLSGAFIALVGVVFLIFPVL